MHVMCPTCGREFATKLGLSLHEKRHLPNEEKPYKCPTCWKGFSTKDGLRLHVKRNIHIKEKEKPFQCRPCKKGFGNKYTFDTHCKRFCPYEEKQDNSATRERRSHERKAHLKTRKNEDSVCDYCGDVFKFKKMLSVSMLDSVYKCNTKKTCDGKVQGTNHGNYEPVTTSDGEEVNEVFRC